jgi:two-component system NtrC family sensor kinase
MLLQRKDFRREATISIACVGALIAIVVTFAARDVWRAYNGAIASGRERSAVLALVLEEQTRRSVQAIDLSLSDIVETLRQQPAMPAHDSTLTKRLRSRLSELPYVRAFFVVGADGFLIHDTDADTPNVSLADRDYFKTHVDRPDGGLYIGSPLKSRSSGAPWFLSVSRRITLDDGRFYGVAVAALEPKYFARFYSQIATGEGGSAALLHRSGTIIARYPDHERGVGLSLANQRIFTAELPVRENGAFVEVSKVDGEERLFSYRLVAPLPLAVVVGLSREVLLADWWNKLALIGMAVLAFVAAMIVALFVFLQRRLGDLAATERLRQIEKTEALGRMTSSIAHDFNNILTVISGNLELIVRRLPTGDALQKRATVALDAAGQGARMVGQLLAFARRDPLEAAREKPDRLVADMSELLRQAAQPCEVQVELTTDGWSCELDRGQFQRALLNLIVNARDASPRGESILISVSNVPRAAFNRSVWPDLGPGDYVACSVRDRGQGMSPETIRHACDPFFTTKPEGLGTGLGLSQAFAFARENRGGIHIDSQVGSGTTVTLVLPRAPDGTTESPAS